MGHLFLQFLGQIKYSGYFTREFSLDFNYWSRSVEWPLKFCLQRFLISSASQWVFVRTSTNFAHLASFQAIEFVDSGQISENKSFLYKQQHSVTVVPEERAHDLILFPRFHAFRQDRLALWPLFLATKKKNGMHFLTRASFTEAPAKIESNGLQTFISHL